MNCDTSQCGVEAFDNDLFESKDFYGEGTSKSYLDQIVMNVAGFVTKSILKRSKCFNCPLFLTQDKSESAILNRKNRGGLIKASDDMIKVCTVVERCFRTYYRPRPGAHQQLFNKCLYSIPEDFLEVNHSDDPLKHRLCLNKDIIRVYLRLRVKYFYSLQITQRRKSEECIPK